METVNLVLSIIASIFSVIAAIVSLENKKDIQSIKNSLNDNVQNAQGDNATQIVGEHNKVGK